MRKSYFNNKIILVNKSSGLTSHDEVNQVRWITGLRRVGHSGTLDPKVTGMLVMATGKATKILEYMLMAEKIYTAEFVFHKNISRLDLEKALEIFTGKITQLPPRKSAVKRVEREREVYDLKLLEFNKSKKTAIIRCAVERGTYIRKLVHDMGEYLGVGAHMGELHRTHVGPFNETDHKTISTTKLKILKKLLPFSRRYLSRCLYSIEQAISFLPGVVIDPGAEQSVLSGNTLYRPGVLSMEKEFNVGDVVVLYSKKNQALAIGSAIMNSDTIRKSERGDSVAIKKVLVEK